MAEEAVQEEAPRTEEETEERAIQDAMEAADAEVQVSDVVDEPPAVVEPPAVETRTAPEPPQTPEEVRAAQDRAEIVRREREVRQGRVALQQQRSAFQKEQEQLAKQAEERALATIKESFKNDPLGTLGENGVDFLELIGREGVNEASADQRTPREIEQLRAEINALKEDRAAERKQAEERNKQAEYETAHRSVLGRIHEVIASDPDTHEAILDRGQPGLQDVFTALNAMFEEAVADGRSPTIGPADIAAAAGVIESAYREQEIADLRQKSGRKRFSGRLTLGDAPNIADAVTATDQTAASQSTTTTTLNNDLQATPPQKRTAPMTEEERFEEALKIEPPAPDKSG